MFNDLQKANLLKRVAALVLDIILLVVLTTGVGMVLSAVLDYDKYSQGLSQYQEAYETQYQVSFDVTQEEYAAMTEQQRQLLNDAYAQFSQDPEAAYYYNMVINMSLLIVSLAVLLAYLGLEFGVPLFLGNGQTVGKKAFGLAVIRQNGVQINAVTLFIRTLLGKYTFETMIPLILGMMILWGAMGLTGVVVIFGIGILQIVLMVTSRTNATIHDKLAQTVVVDLQSQRIFANESDMLAYKARLHEEKVKKQPY